MDVMMFLMFLVCFTIIKQSNATMKSNPDKVYSQQKKNSWYKDGEDLIKENLKRKKIDRKATGVILFLGDGMGISTVTSARVLDGKLKGSKQGDENVLSWENFPNVALSKTYNTDQRIADSAGTATAFLTGVKTFAGAISVNENVKRGSCKNVSENQVFSILEMAEMAGLSTGIVTTTRVTHATPAASYAHSSDRNYENDSKLPKTKDCKYTKDIARQLIEFPYGDGIDVILGGGRREFLPNNKFSYSTEKGRRTDNRNLIKEWEAMGNDDRRYKYVKNGDELRSLDINEVDHVLGLFSPSHMDYAYDRRKGTDSEQPSLEDMTEFAIRMLQKNKKGYFLLVEGGRIDHAHHDNQVYHALHDAVELNRAVQRATELTSEENTLMMVTADHSHVFNLGGYSHRENDLFGFSSDKDKFNKKYTYMGYLNGPGAEKIRKEPKKDELKDPEYVWQSLVPLDYETHAGEDVGIYARGCQAHLVRGVVEQNYIFHVMDYALCLSENKIKYCREQGLISSRKRYLV